MALADTDTIVAIATARGPAGVGIVRISGPKAYQISCEISRLETIKPRYAYYVNFYAESTSSAQTIDSGLLIYFAPPKSYTGEPVVELQGHGSPVLLDWLVARALALGARHARPGEFTERAFLNNKIDLLQAEAVAQLIDASSRQAALAAQQVLQGQFSNVVNNIANELVSLRIFVEAAIDFPEEEIDFLQDPEIKQRVEDVILQITTLIQKTEQGYLVCNGVKIALVGAPNVGKSSLLNILVGEDRSIVTDVPGTTRDVVHETMLLAGVPVKILDTAGLRQTDDIVEQVGIAKAKDVLSQADLLIWVQDKPWTGSYHDPEDLVATFPVDKPIMVVCNKKDLWEHSLADDYCSTSAQQVVSVSAANGVGLDQLREHLLHKITGSGAAAKEGEAPLAARRRQITALKQALEQVQLGSLQLVSQGAGELLAEALKLARTTLGEMTGEFSSDDLLGEIFSSFCIGK